ncbi:hypothetical protein DERF_006873 [Dermatophagoides farinae]|uniref:Bursicon n=2 Tax=Dermatophagoides farinae TaxID=6954 RepID=A0A922HX22_DERFA|nr:hypothetical protein DERF_006873 [Dermatophagoides farinae]
MFRKGKSIWFDRWLLLQLLFVTNLPEKIITGSESSEFIDSNIMVNDGQSIDKHEQTRMAECHLRPVIHILQRAGCIPKPIPSFACYGTCNSYVQVSDSKFWRLERSCNCCQEIGEREASVMLHCPGQTPQYRRVTTRAPVECLCRPCSAVDEQQVKPLEMFLHNHQFNSNLPSALNVNENESSGQRINRRINLHARG